jgi:hypothetical protein
MNKVDKDWERIKKSLASHQKKVDQKIKAENTKRRQLELNKLSARRLRKRKREKQKILLEELEYQTLLNEQLKEQCQQLEEEIKAVRTYALKSGEMFI